jgi:adenylyltransferase/sulfurtransferase
LDATDNWEIRFLLNEACHKHKIPWIYCGAIGSYGMTMNILPGEGNPCLRCFVNESQSSPAFSCSTVGVMNMITGTMASIQTMEAVKILLGSDSVRKELFTLDLWENHFGTVALPKDDDCAVCAHRRYEYLGRAVGSYTTSLCGSNSVQVVPPRPVKADFGDLAEKLKKAGAVRYNQYTLTFTDAQYEIILFQDGRAMIKNAIDGNNAKSVYTEYIGL